MKKHRLILIVLFALIITGFLTNIRTVHAGANWKKITRGKLVYTWYNASYFETNGIWAEKYRTTFRKDGTVIQTGYRNKDIGTYKISKDKKKVVATFRKCYFDTPGKGYERINNYKYKVTYRLKSKKKLYAQYSSKAIHTNASSGYFFR